jgi:hypothetical protein
MDRAKGNPFAIWGAIVELPVLQHFRVVGEVNGESVKGEPANNSGLFGVIWQPPSSHVAIDAAVRRGISSGAPDWLFTLGLTFRVPVPSRVNK